MSAGYCFAEDSRSPQLGSHLAQWFLSKEAEQKRFVHGQDVVGVGERWSSAALQEWLQLHAELNLLMLDRVDMLGGGHSRGREMTGTNYRSTATQEQRNLMVLRHHVLVIRTYSKTSARTLTDKLMPLSVDSFTASYLLGSLLLLRPFAMAAVDQLYPNQQGVKQMYFEKLFVNMDRLFTTEDMTTCLRQYAGDLRPVLSMHSMRHLSIAIRRKLCPGYVMEEMLEDDSADDHVGAAMTGHSVQVERLKYAVSVDSLAGNVSLQVEVNKDLMINDNIYVQFAFSRANR